jgi:hypothetical protein
MRESVIEPRAEEATGHAAVVAQRSRDLNFDLTQYLSCAGPSHSWTDRVHHVVQCFLFGHPLNLEPKRKRRRPLLPSPNNYDGEARNTPPRRSSAV